MPKAKPFTEAEKTRFLEVLASGSTVAGAAQAAGRPIRGFYRHRDSDEAFRRAFEEALELGTQAMEQKLISHALDGWDETMEEYDAEGKLKRRTVNKRWQPTPLIFALKARRPEVYRDNATVVVSGDPDRPVEIAYTPPTLADIFALAQRLGVGIEGEATEETLALESGEG